MSEIEFRDPLFLWVASLAPLAYWLAGRSGSQIRYSSLTIPEQGPRSLRCRLAWLPAVSISLSVVLISIALAGPRTPDAETKVSREGIAIMMVVDQSGSMRARDLVENDVSVDRLSVVKDVFREFVLGEESAARTGRPDDTIGLIAFAGYADSICPLTLDHGNLTSMVEDLEIVSDRNEDGTAIGDALALSVERLRRSEAKTKVAILLTDGVQNVGLIEPKQAAEVARASDVKVYCIGAGTEGRAPFPFIDPFSGRRRLRMVNVELDETTLKMIAKTTAGKYFRATDKDSLQEVYAEIDQLERTKVTEFRYLQYHEHYRWFLGIGLALIGLAFFSNATLFRTLP